MYHQFMCVIRYLPRFSLLAIIEIVFVFILTLALTVWLIKIRRIKTLYPIGVAVYCAYLLFILNSTIFLRQPQNQSHINLEPLWTVGEIVAGKNFYPEIVSNILLMLPVGLIVPVAFPKKGKAFGGTVCVGLVLSLIVEMLQYVMKRGLADIDDLVYNTAGTAAGYVLFRISEKLYICIKCWRKRKCTKK